MSELNIRLVTEDDYDNWLPLWEGYLTFYKSEIPIEVTKETWKRFLDPNEPVKAAVATINDEIVGIAHTIIHRTTWSSQNKMYLEDLFVKPTHRKMGIGSDLIRWVKEYAREKGCYIVYLHTHETNLTAQSVYNTFANKSGSIVYKYPLDEQ